MRNITKPAHYLDSILKLLASDFNKKFNIVDIQVKLNPIRIFKGDTSETYQTYHSPEELSPLNHALNYLCEEGLIHKIGYEYSISFKGYIKIKTKGFAKELLEKSTNTVLQRSAWIIPIIISSISLFIFLTTKK